MKKYQVAAALVAAVASLAGNASSQEVSDRDDASRFVVLVGPDTVAVEDFVWGDGTLESDLRILAANVRFRLAVGFGDDLVPTSFDADMWQPGDDPDAGPTITSSMEILGDSVFAEVIGAQTPEFQRIGTQRGAVPFVNLSFALVEHVVRMRRLAGSGGEVPFFLWANGQTLSGQVAFGEDDSATLTIADVVLELTVDANGQLLAAAVPTQNLTVVRVE
jgi:hypothetical protein